MKPPTTARHYLGAFVMSCLIVAGMVNIATAPSQSQFTSAHDQPMDQAMVGLATPEREADDGASRGGVRAAQPATQPPASPATTPPDTTPVTSTIVPLASLESTRTTSQGATTETTTHSETGKAASYEQRSPERGCAHSTAPTGTILSVTNTESGKTITCVVNDHLSTTSGRVVDLDTTLYAQLARSGAPSFAARVTW